METTFSHTSHVLENNKVDVPRPPVNTLNTPISQPAQHEAPAHHTQAPQAPTLQDQVRLPIRRKVFSMSPDEDNLYEWFLGQFEPPLLETIMQYTNGNKTRASSILGINRGTFRKKLNKYGIR